MLSPESLLLHASLALIVLAVVAQRPFTLRVLIALAAAAGLARALLWTHDMVTAAWTGILLAVTLFLLLRNFIAGRNIRFSTEEKALLDSLVEGLSNSQARHLMDQGLWLTGKEGDVLTREGEPVERLYYLAEGEALVTSGGRRVGLCRAGDLVGEISVLSG